MNKSDSLADCAQCAALAYLVANKVKEVLLFVIKYVPQNEKLTSLLDYYAQQLMENQNVPIEMWNINKYRHRTNNSVEVWNSKLNSAIGKQQPNIFPQVQKRKEEAELVSWQMKWRNVDGLVHNEEKLV
jgi:hypothetical protein